MNFPYVVFGLREALQCIVLYARFARLERKCVCSLLALLSSLAEIQGQTVHCRVIFLWYLDYIYMHILLVTMFFILKLFQLKQAFSLNICNSHANVLIISCIKIWMYSNTFI